jgi:hypothetical protein
MAARPGSTTGTWTPPGGPDRAVFDELRLSRKYARWLLIFDGANDPEEIRKLIPPERQNVMITSRNYEWSATDKRIELDVFERRESIEFLLQRRRGLSEAEAHRLADALGDLPLALEHAVESSFHVTEYLNRLEGDPLDLFSSNPPSAYTDTMANTWRKAIDMLRAEASDEMNLLSCLAFFGSDPIPSRCIDMARYPSRVLSLPQVLRDPVRFIGAIGALRRTGFLSIKPDTRTFHVHRLTQRLVRDRLSAAEAEQSRHHVHLLLAAADPVNPEHSERWVEYEEMYGHMAASDVIGCRDVSVRLLVINYVRYLCAAGDPKAALSLAHDALERWSGGVGIEGFGPDEMGLAMYRAEAEALCSIASFRDAFEVCRNTLGMMRPAAKRWSEEIAALGRITGTRLRKEGDFPGALAADKESQTEHAAIFGRDHPQTFIVMHNLSVDYALNGDYQEAANIAYKAYDRCRTFYGSNHPDHPSTLFQKNAFARCKRLSGEYDAALEIMIEVNARYCSIADKGILREDHPQFLLHRVDFAAAQCDMGLGGIDLEDLAERMYHVYLRCWQTLGIDNPLTLAASITRSSLLRRIPDRLNEAATLVSDTQHQYTLTLGQSHQYTYASGALLASIRRQLSSAKDLRAPERGSDFTPLPL